MSPARVTVCVPVRNGEAFVGETLAALAAQPCDGLAVVVSDDDSTDGSAAVCARFASDPRFHVTRQAVRLGWVAHCNHLLAGVTTEFACLVSHDDVPAPDFVARLVEALDRHPAAALAFSDIRVFGLLDKIEHQPSIDGVTAAERARAFIATHHDGTAFHALIRRSALDVAGGLAPNDRDHFAADVAWLGRLTRAGAFIRVSEPLYAKRRHDASASMQWGRWPAGTLAEAWVMHCRELLHDALAGGGSPADEPRLVEAAIRRVLAVEPELPFALIRAYPRARQEALVRALLDGLPIAAPESFAWPPR